MQHGIDRSREETKVSEAGDTTISEDTSNPFHLIGREPVCFPNLWALLPGLPFGRDFFLQCHRFRPGSQFQAAPTHGGTGYCPKSIVSMYWQVQECRSEPIALANGAATTAFEESSRRH